MPLCFNSLLRDAEIPESEVRLLRHKDQRAAKGLTPYELWRDERPQFELYQSTQAFKNRSRLNSKFWASFVGTPSDETLFVGLYAVSFIGPTTESYIEPHTGNTRAAGTIDVYDLQQLDQFADLDGKLYVAWGEGKRSWVQRADRQNKQITELRAEFKEPEFPGFLNFVETLSRLDRIPPGWKAALRASRGVYLLTCPRTKEQYVGSATGEDGFWHRWQDYIQTGHGGNIALRSRDPADYQVSILEVAGTAMTSDEILAMESRWKSKLQSREMGLNRN